jgi:3D-(3,5/4)-trihydroxycyclohexane-1,2-dione acylhydrolase (decyclizing)
VLYSGARPGTRRFAEATGIPVCETQGGKSSLPDEHPLNMGGRRRHRHRGGQSLAEEPTSCWPSAPAAGLHHRLLGAVQARSKHDHRPQRAAFDAGKHRALPLVADAAKALRS